MSVNMCVPVDASSMKQVVLFLMRFGWSGVCLTATTDKKSLDRVDVKDIPAIDVMKLSSQVTSEEFSGEVMAKSRVARGLPAFKLFTRITVRILEPSDLHILSKATKLNSFDVLAVRPENDDLLVRCCDSAMVDIVTVDFSFRGNWNSIIIKNVEKLKVRGAFFEVCCAAAFRSKESDRVSFFSNVRKLVHAMRGKNIILSLDAREWNETRGPQDLMTLGIMCGMSESDARDAVYTNCNLCLERGFLRSKTWKSAVAVEPASTVKLEDPFALDNAEVEKKKKKNKKKKLKKEKKKASEKPPRSVKKQKKSDPINFDA